MKRSLFLLAVLLNSSAWAGLLLDSTGGGTAPLKTITATGAGVVRLSPDRAFVDFSLDTKVETPLPFVGVIDSAELVKSVAEARLEHNRLVSEAAERISDELGWHDTLRLYSDVSDAHAKDPKLQSTNGSKTVAWSYLKVGLRGSAEALARQLEEISSIPDDISDDFDSSPKIAYTGVGFSAKARKAALAEFYEKALKKARAKAQSQLPRGWKLGKPMVSSRTFPGWKAIPSSQGLKEVPETGLRPRDLEWRQKAEIKFVFPVERKGR